MKSNIVKFKKSNIIQLLSETDKQFIALEKQQQLIREQAKLIAEKYKNV
jgi:hypothetical protein|tara:strand:+ start:56 stop:202 length:147 start_codon:yes stop_codon:yes gene_type:complete